MNNKSVIHLLIHILETEFFRIQYSFHTKRKHLWMENCTFSLNETTHLNTQETDQLIFFWISVSLCPLQKYMNMKPIIFLQHLIFNKLLITFQKQSKENAATKLLLIDLFLNSDSFYNCIPHFSSESSR